ncbi:16S rRNA (cytidine(1402)-2'-O)-methyltransferase [Patescibacteria group bacterium]|nr:16S rRNA (cytidine(1402)-2'-O)-methyltransferase [Patescibacteria group bacterium]MBU4458870.1 16S rRNA (cytidine(1402)-2'-O)-methyltransferase [Patescibacteria group bacterium]
MLYIIATPIGNLKDITLQALEILKSVDLILCEDTRKTSRLCAHYQIKKPLLNYHQHSKVNKVNQIFKLLEQGKNLALVSDAGTPGISDPGNKLVEMAQKKFNDLKIIPIPGPSAVTTALSVCGFPADKFIFLGFCPQKRGRKKFFQQIVQATYTVVFYESPHRILKTLTELNEFLKLDNQQIFVGREMTKKFETIYRGNIGQVLDSIKKDKLKGEFTIVVRRKT